MWSTHDLTRLIEERILNREVFDADDYEPDSPEAVLRCAVAIACSDDEFSLEEQEKVRAVYEDICQELTYAYNAPDVSEDYEAIAQATWDTYLQLDDDLAKQQFIEACGSLVTDNDLRELTLVMALRVAGADAELHKQESAALKRLANLWHINLSDVLRPYRF